MSGSCWSGRGRGRRHPRPARGIPRAGCRASGPASTPSAPTTTRGRRAHHHAAAVPTSSARRRTVHLTGSRPSGVRLAQVAQATNRVIRAAATTPLTGRRPTKAGGAAPVASAPQDSLLRAPRRAWSISLPRHHGIPPSTVPLSLPPQEWPRPPWVAFEVIPLVDGSAWGSTQPCLAGVEVIPLVDPSAWGSTPATDSVRMPHGHPDVVPLTPHRPQKWCSATPATRRRRSRAPASDALTCTNTPTRPGFPQLLAFHVTSGQDGTTSSGYTDVVRPHVVHGK